MEIIKITIIIFISLIMANNVLAESESEEQFQYWENLCYELEAWRAIEACDRAVAIKPNFALGWYNRGVELGELGKYKQAIASYEQSLAINPNYADAWYNKGVCLAQLENYEQAIASWQKTIELEREYLRAWYNLGVVLETLEKDKQALAAYEQVLKINPNFEDIKDRIDNLNKYIQ